MMNPRNPNDFKGFVVELAGFEPATPLLAKQMRYQLRYSPASSTKKAGRKAAFPVLKWAREDLNLRPHPYQGCALTT